MSEPIRRCQYCHDAGMVTQHRAVRDGADEEGVLFRMEAYAAVCDMTGCRAAEELMARPWFDEVMEQADTEAREYYRQIYGFLPAGETPNFPDPPSWLANAVQLWPDWDGGVFAELIDICRLLDDELTEDGWVQPGE